MTRRYSCAVAGVLSLTLAVISASAQSQELFREAFDNAASENDWDMNANTAGTSALFGYDYSLEAVPEAPHTRAGDAATSGVILEANLNPPGAYTIFTLYPLDQNFTGNYQLRFDAWMNYDVNEAVNGTANGTTEAIGGGVGYDNTAADVGSGAQFLATGDGGSASDYRAFKGPPVFFVPPEELEAGGADNALPYYADFLPGVEPPAGQSQDAFIPGVDGSTGFQWLTWELTAINNVVDITVEKSNGERLLLATLDGNDTSDGSSGFNTDGNISLIYGDLFASVSPRADLTFGIIDNVVVTEVTETALGGDYNDDGTVDAADYTVWRDNLGAPAGTLENDVDGGMIGAAQYQTWQENYGMNSPAASTFAAVVPEPSSIMLALGTVGAALAARRRR